MQEWAAETGKEKGLKAAEAFKVMTLVERDGRRINQLSLPLRHNI